MNDITFVDKGEKSAKAGGWLRMLGAIAGAATGTDVSSLTDSAAALVNEIDGFSVTITSYLYRLEWNDEVAGTFYQQYWTDASAPDAQRIAAFDTTSLFKVSYVGKTMTSAGNLASKSFAKSKESQMLKVCTRAIDKSIVQLQRDYDELKSTAQRGRNGRRADRPERGTQCAVAVRRADPGGGRERSYDL